MKTASNAPSMPNTTANTSASTDDASLTSNGAICRPAANPTAATHSQNNFRPKNKITTPMTTPTIVADECIPKDQSRHLQRRGVCAKRLSLTQAPLYLTHRSNPSGSDVIRRPAAAATAVG